MPIEQRPSSVAPTAASAENLREALVPVQMRVRGNQIVGLVDHMGNELGVPLAAINPSGGLEGLSPSWVLDYLRSNISGTVTALVASGMSIEAATAAGHMLFTAVATNTAARVHLEPNGFPGGTAAKLDLMGSPYDEDPVNYWIQNLYTLNFSRGDASTHYGPTAVFGAKSVGQWWGAMPAMHFGFSDNGTVPFKIYYFDTSDTEWRTPIIGAWRQGITGVLVGDYVMAGGLLYRAATPGTTGVTVPSHLTGFASDGGINWEFVRNYTVSASSFRAVVMFGLRDERPKFGFPNAGVQSSTNVIFWNAKSLQFLDSAGTLAWSIRCQGATDELFLEGKSGARVRVTQDMFQLVKLPLVGSFTTPPDGATTFSVQSVNSVYFNNSTATLFTQFTNTKPGQRIPVQSANGNTTLVHGGSLKLAGSANKTITADDCVEFIVNPTGTAAIQVT